MNPAELPKAPWASAASASRGETPNRLTIAAVTRTPVTRAKITGNRLQPRRSRRPGVDRKPPDAPVPSTTLAPHHLSDPNPRLCGRHDASKFAFVEDGDA